MCVCVCVCVCNNPSHKSPQSSVESTHRIRKSLRVYLGHLKDSLVQFFLLQKRKLSFRKIKQFSTLAQLICGGAERRTQAHLSTNERKTFILSYYCFSNTFCQFSLPSHLTYHLWSSSQPLTQLSGEKKISVSLHKSGDSGQMVPRTLTTLCSRSRLPRGRSSFLHTSTWVSVSPLDRSLLFPFP